MNKREFLPFQLDRAWESCHRLNQHYQDFIKLITRTEHKSSFILISDEKCDEMHCFDEELYPIKCLELKGLDNVEIIRNMGLKDEDCWLKLMQLYEENFSYLKDIAIHIQVIYDGHVSEFFAENNIILTGNIEYHLTKIFNRLTP